MKNNFAIKEMRQQWFLLLLPLFFVFHGYVENYLLVPLADTFGLIIFYSFVCFLLSCLFYSIFKSWRKASVFVFFILSLHFFFGSLHDFIKKYFADVLFTKYVFLLPAFLVLTIVVFIYIKKTNATFKRLTKFLTLVFILFLLIDAVTLLQNRFLNKQNNNTLPFQLSPCDTCTMPDVYFIVADEYPGKQALIDIFDFDNTPFQQSLQNLGFHLINHSKSNYNFTPFSIASTLNMDYLALKDTNHTFNDVPMIMTMISENSVAKFFKKQGYQILNQSVFDLPGEPKQITSTFLPYKLQYITAQTLVSRIEKDLYYHLIASLKIKSFVNKHLYSNLTNNQLVYKKTIEVSLKKTVPKFSYTHLSMPHPPYYFNENGKPNPRDSLNSTSKNIFLGYLKYTNKKLIHLLSQIIQNNAEPPVIFLVSDHGYRDDSPTYHFSNLMAVHIPNRAYNVYYDELSLVNLFRIFLNQQFNQQLPLLQDKTVLLKD